MAALCASLGLPVVTSATAKGPTARAASATVAPAGGYVAGWCRNSAATSAYEIVRKSGQTGCTTGETVLADRAAFDAYGASWTARAYCYDDGDTTRANEYVFEVKTSGASQACGTGRTALTASDYAAWRASALGETSGGSGGSGSTLPATSDCPAVPAAYSGTDVVVAELRLVRDAIARDCAAGKSWSDRAETQRSDVRASVDGLEGLSSTANGLLGDVKTALAGTLTVSPAGGSMPTRWALDEPQKVDVEGWADVGAIEDAITAQGPNTGGSSGGSIGGTEADPAVVRLASSDGTSTLIEDATAAIGSGLWFLVGLSIVGGIAAPVLRRLLWP